MNVEKAYAHRESLLPNLLRCGNVLVDYDSSREIVSGYTNLEINRIIVHLASH